MSLSIHRRTGHGRALLLSTVCNTEREQREVKSASASAGIPRIVLTPPVSTLSLKNTLEHA